MKKWQSDEPKNFACPPPLGVWRRIRTNPLCMAGCRLCKSNLSWPSQIPKLLQLPELWGKNKKLLIIHNFRTFFSKLHGPAPIHTIFTGDSSLDAPYQWLHFIYWHQWNWIRRCGVMDKKLKKYEIMTPAKIACPPPLLTVWPATGGNPLSGASCGLPGYKLSSGSPISKLLHQRKLWPKNQNFQKRRFLEAFFQSPYLDDDPYDLNEL